MPFRSPPTTPEAAETLQYVDRVAALSFLLYDILLTFDDEVRFILCAATSVTALTLSRFISSGGTSSCVSWQISGLTLRQEEMVVHEIQLLFRALLSSSSSDRYQGPVLVLTIISCDLILLARIYILYFDSKYVQQLVSFSFILEIIGLGLGIRGMRFNEICVVVDTPHGFLYYAGAIITFQTILFGLTLYKFIEGVRVGWGNVPIVKLVMRDGTWAFFTLF
ncbi:hypothetical protein WG66_014530, partial [Moniliophthora roreri]